jgi:hypothetical protein
VLKFALKRICGSITREQAMMRWTAICALGLALLQPGCVMVGGYSSSGGWFFWPGGLGLLLLIIVVLFLFTRRRR